MIVDLAPLARMFSTLSDQLVSIREEGDIDARQASACRSFSMVVGDRRFPYRATALQELTETDDEEAWYRSWRDHVGALPKVWGGILTPWWARALAARSRLVWLDELDAMSDQSLREFRGLGPKSLANIRAVLDAYYWRADRVASREMWAHILDRMRKVAEYEHLCEDRRERVLHGSAFAERVLAEDGAPLADPKAPRMVP